MTAEITPITQDVSYWEKALETHDKERERIVQMLKLTKQEPDPKTQRSTYKLLWDLWNVLDDHEGYGPGNNYGTIISRYAHIIDDRIENSGHSRAVESLKLYTTDQLEEELKSRQS